jgi:hypothetical protein
MQKVGLYLIISTDSFYDGLINLNKFFRIARVVILINVACLELGRPPDPPEWPYRARNSLLHVGVTPHVRNHYRGLDVLSRMRL